MKISQCYSRIHSTKLILKRTANGFWLSEDPKGYDVAFKEGFEERFKKQKAKKRGYKQQQQQ